MFSQRGILIFAMIFPTLAALSYFELFSSPNAVQVLYSASKVLQFSIPVLVIFVWQKRKWKMSRPSRLHLLLGFGWGLIFASSLIATYFLLKDQQFMVNVRPLLQEKMMAFDATRPSIFLMFGAFVSVLHSFLEEYYWRWYVHNELKKYMRPWLCVLLSGFAFMAHHVVIIQAYLPAEIYWQGMFVFPLFVWIAGITWAWLYDKYRSLWIPWISHILADIAIFWIGYQILWT